MSKTFTFSDLHVATSAIGSSGFGDDEGGNVDDEWGGFEQVQSKEDAASVLSPRVRALARKSSERRACKVGHALVGTRQPNFGQPPPASTSPPHHKKDAPPSDVSGDQQKTTKLVNILVKIKRYSGDDSGSAKKHLYMAFEELSYSKKSSVQR